MFLSGCGLISHGTYQKIRFVSDPPGAEVWANDQKLATGEDMTASLPRHETVVTFKKAGYLPEEVTLKCKTSPYFYWSLVMGILAAGVDWFVGSWREFEQDTVSVTLTPEPGTRPQRTVVVTSSPPGAEVFIGTVSLGRTKGQGEPPLTVLLTWDADRKIEESKTLEFRLYDHETKQVILKWGDNAIFAKLDPKPEEIEVEFFSEPADATVTVDGIPVRGRTPTKEKFTWVGDTKPKKVEFRKAGYQPLSLTLNRGDKTLKAVLKEVVTESLLKIETVPAGAYIEVDGILSGPAPSEIALKWSVQTTRHKVRCILPGYQTSQELTVEKATQSPVRISLKPMLPKLP